MQRILAVRNDRFGEFLLNIPALRALRETFKGEVTLLVDHSVKELALRVPYADNVIEWDQKKHSPFELFVFARQLRKGRFDAAVMLNPSKELNIATFLAGIPRRVGYDRKFGFLLSQRIEDKKHLGDTHEIDYNLNLVALLGVKTADRTLRLSLNDSEAFALLSRLGLAHVKDFIAVHPYTSDPLKQWPLAHFNQLIRLLKEELGKEIVIVGANPEIPASFQFPEYPGKGVINLIGKTSLSELAAVLSRSKLLISADSGPVHLAGCFNVPVLAFFRNDLEGKTARRWGPVSRGSVVMEKNNLSEITPSEALLKVKEMLIL